MSTQAFPPLRYFNISFAAEYVAHVEINRPDKLNAFIDPMWYELKVAFDFLSSHPDVRVVLLSAAGDRAFTAGLDVTQAAKPDSILFSTAFPDPARKAAFLRRHVLQLQDTISAVAKCEKPVICLMHGIAFGLGIDLSSACDIRLCSSDARFSVKEVDVGLAADVGTLSRLPKVLGGLTSWAKDVCYTAREFDAAEALSNRYVSHVVDGGKRELWTFGLAKAQLIAKKSPVAVQTTKNILDATWGKTVEDNLNYTAVTVSSSLQTADLTAAMNSFSTKKKPTFAKL